MKPSGPGLCFLEVFIFQIVFIYLFTLLFGAKPTVYGGSQARGLIGAIAASSTTATAMPDLSHVCGLQRSSQQLHILNPRSEVRDRTRNLMVPSQINFLCTTTGTPETWYIYIIHSQQGQYHPERNE